MTHKAPYASLLRSEPEETTAEVLARCEQALREGGLWESEIKTFLAEATAADETHLQQIAMRWFDVL
jgi:hypothetical protein